MSTSKNTNNQSKMIRDDSSTSIRSMTGLGRSSTFKALSQMSGVMSPELAAYSVFQPPRGEQRRPVTAPSSTTLSSSGSDPVQTPNSTTSDAFTHRSSAFTNSSPLMSSNSFPSTTARQTFMKAVKGLGFGSVSPHETCSAASTTSSRRLVTPSQTAHQGEDYILRPYVPASLLEVEFGPVGTEIQMPPTKSEEHVNGMAAADRPLEKTAQATSSILQMRILGKATLKQAEVENDGSVQGQLDVSKPDSLEAQGLEVHINTATNQGVRGSSEPLDCRQGHGLGIRFPAHTNTRHDEEPKVVSSEASLSYAEGRMSILEFLAGDKPVEEAEENAIQTKFLAGAIKSVEEAEGNGKLQPSLLTDGNNIKLVEQAESRAESHAESQAAQAQVQEDPFLGGEASEAFLGGKTRIENQAQQQELKVEEVFAPNFYDTRATPSQSLVLQRPDLIQAQRLRKRASAKTPEVAASAPQPAAEEQEYNLPSVFNPHNKSSNRPIDANSELIEEILEENYRALAETFARKSSVSISSHSSSAQITPNTRLLPRSASPGPLSLRIPSARNTPDTRVLPSSAGPLPLRVSSAPTYSYITPTRLSFVPSSGRRLGTPKLADTPAKLILKPYRIFSPLGQGSHIAYGHKLETITSQGVVIVPPRIPIETRPRGIFYFTLEEREHIDREVSENFSGCEHEDCVDCREREYAYYENKAMPTTMPPEDRQRIINNNRSLRNIKNELERLAEHAAIPDDIYDKIMGLLPAESPLNGSAGRVTPSPAPTAALSNLGLDDVADAPPSYNNPTPPSLPNRQPSAPPTKPELWRATALYRYDQPGDCNFEVGDQIAVHTEMNQDWWMGKNTRTGQEGVFPSNYVQKQMNPSPLEYYGNREKASAYPGGYPGLNTQNQQYQPYQQQGPPPPGPSNPYDASVPPMAVVEQPTSGKPSKGQEMGKKFGKKMGNAVIFGAGATIGSDIVNSIF